MIVSFTKVVNHAKKLSDSKIGMLY